MKTVIAIIMTNVHGGGTPRHAYEMAAEWSRQGVQVLFVYANDRLIKVFFMRMAMHMKLFVFLIMTEKSLFCF